MRAICSAAVSSALLSMLGILGTHPAFVGTATVHVIQDISESVLIAEIYPCAVSGDEYVILCNCGEEPVRLDGWILTDGEGMIEFCSRVLGVHEWLSISENGTSYERAYGHKPDIDTDGWAQGDGVLITGSFRLADAGDDLMLMSAEGDIADAVVYGTRDPPPGVWSGDAIPSLRQGEVARRSRLGDSPVDSDSPYDWEPFREFRYGYTAFESPASTVPSGDVTGFTSPDCALDVILESLGDARSDIRVCCYELSSVPISRALERAASYGVDVSILVESNPVGGMSEAQTACLSRLALAGCDVRVLGGNLQEDIVRHVGTIHAKYVVIDEESLICLSENLVEEGVPGDRVFGNRGWGVLVKDPYLASWLAGLFDEDSRPDRPDVWDWRGDDRYIPDSEFPSDRPTDHDHGILSPFTSVDASVVRIHASPDASSAEPFLCPLIARSRMMLFEQFQADLFWTYRWSSEPAFSPVIDALVRTMHAGAEMRGLLDSTWYNLEGNGLVLDSLRSSAVSSASGAQFALMDNRSPIGVLHNKGLVLDSSIIVSSNNWVYSSFSRNRELAVVVESPALASYFSKAFELDWVPDTMAPVADAGPDIVMGTPDIVRLNGSGSRDDRIVVNWSWDTDRDGHWDLHGESPEFTSADTGVHEILLRVADSYGNTAYDTVIIEVTGRSPTTSGRAEPWPVVWAVIGSCAGVLLTLFTISRKFNLIPPGSRRTGKR